MVPHTIFSANTCIVCQENLYTENSATQKKKKGNSMIKVSEDVPFYEGL
jgi:hypothetical protein